MQSKNKRPQTSLERKHLQRVAELQCAVCGTYPVQVHEPEQGKWFISIPLCPECHTGDKGWHGTRDRWKLAKVTELSAINWTHEQLAMRSK